MWSASALRLNLMRDMCFSCQIKIQSMNTIILKTQVFVFWDFPIILVLKANAMYIRHRKTYSNGLIFLQSKRNKNEYGTLLLCSVEVSTNNSDVFH